MPENTQSEPCPPCTPNFGHVALTIFLFFSTVAFLTVFIYYYRKYKSKDQCDETSKGSQYICPPCPTNNSTLPVDHPNCPTICPACVTTPSLTQPILPVEPIPEQNPETPVIVPVETPYTPAHPTSGTGGCPANSWPSPDESMCCPDACVNCNTNCAPGSQDSCCWNDYLNTRPCSSFTPPCSLRTMQTTPSTKPFWGF